MTSAESMDAQVGNAGAESAVGKGTDQKAGHGGTTANGHELTVSSGEKGGMSEELKDIFNKLIDDQGHLDMRNVTTLIWVNRKKPEIVETIVELLIENSNERRVFNGIEFYLPQLAHMIIHLDVHLPTSALEQFALVVCQQSLHVALQLNWILVAALEDYHAELPDGSRNKKANSVYFNRCAKLLQNVERIIALGAPSAAGLEELYATGKLSKHEMESRTIAERRRQAEKVIGSPQRGSGPLTEEARIKGWLWHKRWYKRDFPHHSRWIRRWFEVEDRVLYCYSTQDHKGQRVKRAAVLYQASVVVCDYKDGRYPHYFEVHSPMGNMRLRADDAAGKEAWVTSLQKQAKAMPSVAHFYSQDGLSATTAATSRGTSQQLPSITSSGDDQMDMSPATIAQSEKPADSGYAARDHAGNGATNGGNGSANHDDYLPAVTTTGTMSMASDLLASTADARKQIMSSITLAHMEAKRNKRFRFFNDERKFVSDLTDICEALRFVENRSQRGGVLETLLSSVHVPDCAYLPLCRSTDAFQRVLRITPGEAKAFSTKERVPVMMTFELQQTWPPRTPRSALPLDVASYLHFVYGSHAPVHQDRQRYSSVALGGGENSIMEPDRLAVGDSREGEDGSGGMRHSRSGSFRFRSGSNRITFPHMPPMQFPGNFPTVWREKTPGTGPKDSRASKSPFRHNLSSLSSALHARASSIRNVKLPGVLQSVSKRSGGGPLHTPSSVGAAAGQAQQQHTAAAGGEEKSGISGETDGRERRRDGSGSAMSSSKNVAWEDGGVEEEKVFVPNGDGTGRVGRGAGIALTGSLPTLMDSIDDESKADDNDKDADGGDVELVDDRVALEKAFQVPVGMQDVSLKDKEDGTAADDEKEPNTTMANTYGEGMSKKAERIRRQSTEGTREGWTLQRMIVKSNDDVRQEVFIMQLIIFYKEVFEREGLDLYLRPYSILSTAKTTGLIQFLDQATSMDGLKKSDGYAGSLLEHFHAAYGSADSAGFKKAQQNFLCSLAGYSVVSYLLRIKDRHNGNVMLDSEGHIVHIDFGFVLGSAPGKQFSMERAAFKLTPEYLALLGGKGSELYEEFVDMFTKGLLAARKYATITITMIEIMMFQSEFPCFEYAGEAALKGFKRRLMLGMKDSDVKRRARNMVERADGHWGTCFYDKFQLWSNGIMP